MKKRAKSNRKTKVQKKETIQKKKITIKKENTKFIISIIALILLLVLLFNYFVNNNPLFDPIENINQRLTHIAANPNSYTIVVSDIASADEISAAARFAAAYRVSKAENQSDISNSNYKIFIGQSSKFINNIYSAKIGNSDLAIILNSTQNSLYIFSKGSVISNSLIDSINPENSALGYDEVIYSGGIFKKIIEGNVIEVTRSFGAMALTLNTMVTLNVRVNYDIYDFILTEMVPAGWRATGFGYEFDAISANDGNGTYILATTSGNILAKGDYIITYTLKPNNTAGTFSSLIYGKVGLVNSQEFTYFTGGQTSACVENWTCSSWGECVFKNGGKEATRTCLDNSGCNTEKAKPFEIDNLCSPGCTALSGQNTFNINVKDSYRYGGIVFSDECIGNGKIREYGCDNNGIINSTFNCFECNVAQGTCTKEFECIEGETLKTKCLNNDILVDSSTCAGNKFVEIADPQLSCPVLINEAKNQISGSATGGNGAMYTNPAQYKIVIGRAASTSDSIGAIELAGKYNLSETVIDDNVVYNNMVNVIIVGGPAVNRFAASFLNLNLENFPFNGVDSTIPTNDALIVVNKTTNGNKVLIAGWEAVNTRNAVKAFMSFDDTKLNSQKVIVKGSTLGVFTL